MAQDKSKALINSKTFWGAFVVIVSQVAGLYGYDMGNLAGWGDNFMDLVLAAISSDITGILGAIWAIYGRVRSVEKIGGVLSVK